MWMNSLSAIEILLKVWWNHWTKCCLIWINSHWWCHLHAWHLTAHWHVLELSHWVKHLLVKLRRLETTWHLSWHHSSHWGHAWGSSRISCSGSTLGQLFKILLRHHLHVFCIHELTEMQHLIQILFFTQNIEILLGTHFTGAIIGWGFRQIGILILQLSHFSFQSIFFLFLLFNFTGSFVQLLLQINNGIKSWLSLLLKFINLFIFLRDLQLEILFL